ncbi:MAG: pilin [Candidatus Gracilibacteria bacterium]|nr:pilin [Candidatus Gracilibacteria bacterium]
MKKLYLYIIVFISSFYSLVSFAKNGDTSLIEKMSPKGKSIVKVTPSTTGEDGLSALDNLLNIIRDIMFGILPTFAVLVFLFIGAKLFMARGNQEEFKKSLMWFVYAAVGMAIIPLAWGVIKLLTTITL